MEELQLYDVDDTPISPVTSSDTVYMKDGETSVQKQIEKMEEKEQKLSQSLTVNKIDLLIDDNKSCKFNCDGYKYLLICAANDSKIINVDLLKLIGSINLGFIRYSSESYIGACSINIKPTYITLHGFYNKGYSYSTYQVYGIK